MCVAWGEGMGGGLWGGEGVCIEGSEDGGGGSV